MNILDSIMTAGNGAAVRQLGSQLGLDEAQTASALSVIVPALSSDPLHDPHARTPFAWANGSPGYCPSGWKDPSVTTATSASAGEIRRESRLASWRIAPPTSPMNKWRLPGNTGRRLDEEDVARVAFNEWAASRPTVGETETSRAPKSR